jgi:hypothetical protein
MNMNNVIDFYKKVSADPQLKAEAEAAVKGLGDKPGKEQVVSATIAFAQKHGVTLRAEDFEGREGELNEDDLKAVAGGNEMTPELMEKFASGLAAVWQQPTAPRPSMWC